MIAFLFVASWQASLHVGGGTLNITAQDSLPRAKILAWIDSSARAVSLYFGRFPVKQVSLTVRDGSISGRTYGNPAHIDVEVPAEASVADLHDDWVLVHEMVHLALPSQTGDHTWFEEGSATFVEPVARARAGHRAPALVWREWLTRMREGEPLPRDRGLDHTHTWARTYWGGALYFLVAEVRLRVATHGAMGVETALRGVLAAGGSVNDDWSIDKTLAAADAATGLHVLRNLYDEMKDAPAPVDLPALFAALGVGLLGDEVIYDDDAKWAFARKRIMASD